MSLLAKRRRGLQQPPHVLLEPLAHVTPGLIPVLQRLVLARDGPNATAAIEVAIGLARMGPLFSIPFVAREVARLAGAASAGCRCVLTRARRSDAGGKLR